MRNRRLIAVYGTVMATRPEGRETMHRVEATGPGGDRLDLLVLARQRHRGSVRVWWDPKGEIPPRFDDGIPWTTIGVAAGIVVVIVLGGWLLFG